MCGRELREPAHAYPAISKRFGRLSSAGMGEAGRDWPLIAILASASNCRQRDKEIKRLRDKAIWLLHALGRGAVGIRPDWLGVAPSCYLIGESHLSKRSHTF